MKNETKKEASNILVKTLLAPKYNAQNDGE